MSENTGALFLTGAKGIQAYIMATDGLREMVGASELVEQVPVRLLNKTIAELGLSESDQQPLIQSAGGAVHYFTRQEDALRLAKIWPFIVSQFAPGLEMVQSVVPCAPDNIFAALETGEYQLRSRRNLLFPDLPGAGPLIDRNRRSGLPAVSRFKGNPVDRQLARKLALGGAQREMLCKLMPETFTDEINHPEHFPLDINAIASESNPYLAIVHIDVNQLGQRRIELGERLKSDPGLDQREVLRTFALAIKRSMETAAKTAVEPIMAVVGRGGDSYLYPFRPVVIAGDDLTMILRASDALGFVERFLMAFENESKAQLEKLFGDETSCLTACAGIAYVKSTYPFALAYQLCESLCKYAKTESERTVSALAFHRVTTGIGSNYEQVKEQELTLPDKNAELTMNPYLVGPAAREIHWLPHLDDLLALKAMIFTLPKGSLRGIASKVYDSIDAADRAFERYGDILPEQKRNALRDGFAELTGNRDRPLWKADRSRQKTKTPLYDTLELLAVERGGAMADEIFKATEVADD